MLDLEGIPTQVNLAVGTRTVVSLPSFANSGNLWSVAHLSGDDVADASIRFGPLEPPTQPGADPGDAGELTTAEAPVDLVLEARSYGTEVLRLTLAQPWQPEPPTATHDLEVVVAQE